MAEGRLHQPMERQENRFAGIMRYLGRIFVPAAALLAAGIAGFLARGDAAGIFGAPGVAGLQFEPGAWLTMGHIWVFALFLIVNLTGRRYGASVAFGALVLAALAAAGIWAYANYGAAQLLLPADAIAALGDRTMVLAVALSVATGLALDIVIFDLVRGRPWWKAPLLAPLFGGAAYVALFHALAADMLAGTWSERAVTHFTVWAVGTLLMLLIYHLLRSLVRPLPGYGGA